MLQSSRRILRRSLYGDASVGQKELPRSTTHQQLAEQPSQAHDALRRQTRHGVREQSAEEFVRVVAAALLVQCWLSAATHRSLWLTATLFVVVVVGGGGGRAQMGTTGTGWPDRSGSPGPRRAGRSRRCRLIPAPARPQLFSEPACRATRYACQLVEMAWLIDD